MQDTTFITTSSPITRNAENFRYKPADIAALAPGLLRVIASLDNTSKVSRQEAKFCLSS